MLFDLSGKHGLQPDLSYLCQHEAEPSLQENETPIAVPELESPFALGRTQISEQSISSSKLAERLAAAKRTAHSRQLRLRVPTILTGILGFVLCMAMYFIPEKWAVLAANYLLCICIFFSLLALLPSDRRAVPLFCCFILIPGLLLSVALAIGDFSGHLQKVRQQRCLQVSSELPCWFIYAQVVERACNIIAQSVGIVRSMLVLQGRVSSRALLSRMWSILGWTMLVIGIGLLSIAIIGLLGLLISTSIRYFAACVPMLIGGTLMLVDNDIRSKIQSWFVSRSEAAITAAGVAELLGGQNIDTLLIASRSTFKFVRADRVTYADMEHNRLDANLATLTEEGRFGFVDAFVSHSWHDDSRKKWIALQKLREEFKLGASREPRLWIDKYSIDQDNLESSLASLPIYLAGCTQLWILCGPTYLERLWCLVEIYVFIEMGGLRSNLRVELLDDGQWMSHLDPRKAQCFHESDTERLRAVIETTGYEQICQLVKDVFPRA